MPNKQINVQLQIVLNAMMEKEYYKRDCLEEDGTHFRWGGRKSLWESDFEAESWRMSGHGLGRERGSLSKSGKRDTWRIWSKKERALRMRGTDRMDHMANCGEWGERERHGRGCHAEQGYDQARPWERWYFILSAMENHGEVSWGSIMTHNPQDDRTHSL